MVDLVLVRAAGGEPLVRAVVSVGEKHIYVSREDLLKAVDSGDKYPVGFPKDDVFQYDMVISTKLVLLWPCGESAINDIWNQCTPYSKASWVRKV